MAQKGGELEIKAYAVSMSTLEDVFLNITSDKVMPTKKYNGKEISLNFRNTKGKEERIDLGGSIEEQAKQLDIEISTELVKPATSMGQIKVLLKKRV